MKVLFHKLRGILVIELTTISEGLAEHLSPEIRYTLEWFLFEAHIHSC